MHLSRPSTVFAHLQRVSGIVRRAHLEERLYELLLVAGGSARKGILAVTEGPRAPTLGQRVREDVESCVE